jgi:hypothetical protein
MHNFATLPAQDVNVINADDDTAGFTLSPTSASVIEGESTSYDIVLDAPPSADVVIDLTSSNPDVTSPASVTFTPSDWDTPQTITLTTLDNLLIDGTRIATITHDVTSTDSAYDVLPSQDFTLTIGDNDSAGILIDTPINTVDEGDSLTYNVRLTSQPIADVIVTVTSLNPEATPDTTTLTFTPTDWNIPQDVVLTVADNTTPEADRLADVVHSISSADSAYDALPDQTPIFNIVDNDAPATPSPEATTEVVPTDTPTETDGDAVWDIQLDAVPTLLIDGQTVTFTMTVRKLSGGTPVRAELPLSDGFEIESVSVNRGEAWAEGQIVVYLDDLHVGEVGITTIVTRITPLAPEGLQTACIVDPVNLCDSAELMRVYELPSTGETPPWRLPLIASLLVFATIVLVVWRVR